MKVRIEQFDRTIEVGADETILECALHEGLDYPFACQQGQCGSCKSLLVAGSVDMGNLYNPLALPEAERARGLILACQAQPRSDCVVSVVELGGEIVHAQRDLTCSVIEVLPAGRDARIARLRVDAGGPFNFVAGQYAAVTFPGCPPRDFSMANRPDEATLEFHVRCRAHGTVGPFVRDRLAPGMTVNVRGPAGQAYLHDEHLGPILALAGGTGLAPMLAIVETALSIGMPQRIDLVFGVHGEADLYYVDRLRSLAARHRSFRWVTVLEQAAEDHRRGTVLDVLAADYAQLGAYRVYAAGPPAMCDAARELALARGLAPEHWAADPFVEAN